MIKRNTYISYQELKTTIQISRQRVDSALTTFTADIKTISKLLTKLLPFQTQLGSAVKPKDKAVCYIHVLECRVEYW